MFLRKFNGVFWDILAEQPKNFMNRHIDAIIDNPNAFVDRHCESSAVKDQAVFSSVRCRNMMVPKLKYHFRF